MISRSLFTSKSNEWATPQSFFDALSAEFGPFDLDPCATPENAKCARFFTIEQDGLKQKWSGKVFMNPPYGKQIGQWIVKAKESAQGGALVVCMIPARTDTKYWHEHIQDIAEVRFVKGRIKFGDSKGSAPFPSVVVIYRP